MRIKCEGGPWDGRYRDIPMPRNGDPFPSIVVKNSDSETSGLYIPSEHFVRRLPYGELARVYGWCGHASFG